MALIERLRAGRCVDRRILRKANLRPAMLIARGDPAVFMTRPISAGLLMVALLLLALAALR